MFKKILACLDGSELAEQILPYAVDQALRFDSQLVLFYVLGPDELPAAAGIGAEELMKKQIQAEAEVRAYLENLAGQLSRDNNLSVESVTASGSVGETIIDYARRNGVGLIAIATHGQSGARRLVFGSVADFLLRNSNIPMLVIRPVAK